MYQCKPPLILFPAYQRMLTTKTMKQHLMDWCNGLDMKIEGGPYLSNRDLPKLKEDGYSELYFRLADGKTRKVAI